MKPSEIVQALAADLAQHLDKMNVAAQQGRYSIANPYLPHNLAPIMQTFIVDWMLGHNVSIKDDQAPKVVVVDKT